MKYDIRYLLLIYALLIIQITITFSVVYQLKYLNKDLGVLKTNFKTLFLVLLTFPIIILLSIEKLSKILKLLLLTCLSVIFGIMLYPSLKSVNNQTIINVLLTTIGVFIIMSLLAFYATLKKYNLGDMRYYLFISLLGLILSGTILLFYPNSRAYSIYLIAGTIIFSLYVLSDTNIMLKRRKNVIDSVVNFYLDFINLFINIFGLYNNQK